MAEVRHGMQVASRKLRNEAVIPLRVVLFIRYSACRLWEAAVGSRLADSQLYKDALTGKREVRESIITYQCTFALQRCWRRSVTLPMAERVGAISIRRFDNCPSSCSQKARLSERDLI